MDDLISRQAAVDAIRESTSKYTGFMEMEMYTDDDAVEAIEGVPSAQPEREDYTEMKQEFLRMASYIDVLLECSDEQKETLMGFISRLSEYMPWTERD